jgi:hypothetical protein
MKTFRSLIASHFLLVQLQPASQLFQIDIDLIQL